MRQKRAAASERVSGPTTGARVRATVSARPTSSRLDARQKTTARTPSTASVTGAYAPTASLIANRIRVGSGRRSSRSNSGLNIGTKNPNTMPRMTTPNVTRTPG